MKKKRKQIESCCFVSFVISGCAGGKSQTESSRQGNTGKDHGIIKKNSNAASLRVWAYNTFALKYAVYSREKVE